MGRTSVAPRQLPMAPRPIVGELVSSWLSRVAAANCISLDELLDALSLVNRWSRSPSECLDVNLDLVMQLALSDFCRVPSELVSQLTLVRQLPGVRKEMFLSSPKFFSVSGCQQHAVSVMLSVRTVSTKPPGWAILPTFPLCGASRY